MGKIFNPPKGYTPPDIGPYAKRNRIDQYFKDCEKYVDRLKATFKKAYGSVCPEAGEEIQFPVGDGYARYIVARLKPVELVWVNVGDAWHYQYVHRLTAADIREELRSEKAMRKLFSDSRKKKTKK